MIRRGVVVLHDLGLWSTHQLISFGNNSSRQRAGIWALLDSLAILVIIWMGSAPPCQANNDHGRRVCRVDRCRPLGLAHQTAACSYLKQMFLCEFLLSFRCTRAKMAPTPPLVTCLKQNGGIPLSRHLSPLVLLAETPPPDLLARHGSYHDMFASLFQRAINILPACIYELHVKSYNIVDEPWHYPSDDDLSEAAGVLITGSDAFPENG